MVKQYPNSVRFEWVGIPTQDSNGDMVAGASGSMESECRAEPNGKGQTITSPDGALINYSYTVYLPKPITEILPVGAKAILNLWGRSVECTVKRFDRNFFNSTVWL